MEKRERSILESAYGWLADRIWENRIPMICGLAAGLLAHAFAFTNKLVNADEVWSLFDRGASVTSGRWGLELSKWIFPSISMPWIYGVLSILMLTVAACVTVRIFRIQSRCLQGLLAAVFVSFPSATSMFCFMFTSAPYSLAFLLAILAVYLTERGGRAGWITGAVLLVLAVGTYQAYVAVAASFFVIRMIQKLLLREGTAGEILRYGLLRVGMLLACLIVYYALSLAALKLTGEQFSEYGVARWTSIFYKAAIAYSAFFHTFTRGYFAFVRTPLSMVMHGLLLITAAAAVVRWLAGKQDLPRVILMLLCLLLFPLSAYCIYLIAETDIIHSMVLNSFVSVYVLAAVAVESLELQPGRWGRDAAILSLTLILLGNVFFANKIYLKMHLQYEQAYSIYTSIVTRIESIDGFDGEKKIAIVGSGRQQGVDFEELSAEGLLGPNVNLINIYTRDLFLQRYLGFDAQFATEGERYKLENKKRVKEMPSYPYEGSIRVIGDFIVVKLD